EKPANLAIIVIDNEHYGETGMQPAHTGRGTDLTGIATAAGFPKAFIVRTQEELDELAGEVFGRDGLLFAVIKVSTAPIPVSLPPRDWPYLRSRFREALLKADAHR